MIYLAAPFSNPDPEITKAWMESYRQASNHLNEHGLFTASPLMNYFLGMGGTWEIWKDYSENMLARSDKMIVLTLDGWSESTGVQAEIQFCQENNIPIEYKSLSEILSLG